MKLFVCSDLHTEFLDMQEQKALFKKFPDTDGIIVAGDLSTKKYLVDNLKYLCDKYKYVIFVAGNHEYYHSSFLEVDRMLTALQKELSNLYLLNTVCHRIDNNLFMGTTLWFKDTPLNQLYEKQMNDFEFIKDFRKLVYEENDYATQSLQSITNEYIVVTHHLPSYQSVNEKYKGDQLNRFFVCDMENLILDKQPKYWLHGHSHDSCDYMLDSTRVICNPLGYKNQNNINFNNNLIIEL